MRIPTALLCTVGTSMSANLPDLLETDPEAAGRRLTSLSNPRDGGAEYQTIRLLLDQPKRLHPMVLRLFCSDSHAGRQAAATLQAAFGDRFADCSTVVCEGLRVDEPKVFATRGLRSLVNGMIQCIRTLKAQGHLPALDATGGYKPQIAYAAIIGQMEQVPVYYRNLDFDEILELQPLPITLDPGLWFDHLEFFTQLRDDLLPDREIPQGDARLTPFLHREDRLVTLSPLGEVLCAAAERFVATNRQRLLPERTSLTPDQKRVSYEDGNPGKHRGLEAFVDRLLRNAYVTGVTTWYFNRDLPRSSRMQLSTTAPVGSLEAWYGDGKALTKLYVHTTARSPQQLAAVRAELEEEAVP